MPTKSQALQIIAEHIDGCKVCPDLCGRTKTVPGYGNVHSPIVLCGEAPGADEDAQGLPFVGKAGKLLNNLLRAAGIDRDDVFVLNTIKCRPPRNRTPTEVETSNCANFLSAQLKVLRPKVLVLMGTPAVKRFFPDFAGATACRGHFYPLAEPVACQAFVTYHPSFCFHNPSEKLTVVEDFIKVKDYIMT